MGSLPGTPSLSQSCLPLFLPQTQDTCAVRTVESLLLWGQLCPRQILHISETLQSLLFLTSFTLHSAIEGHVLAKGKIFFLFMAEYYSIVHEYCFSLSIRPLTDS